MDLIKRMMTFDPLKRITIDEAMLHPYMNALHFPDDEPTTVPVSCFDFDFELYNLTKEDYKDLIYEEIMINHDENLMKEYEKNKLEFPEGILFKRYNKDRVKKRFQV